MQKFRPLLIDAILRLLTIVMKRIRIEPNSTSYNDNRIIVDQAIWNDDEFFKELIAELKTIRSQFSPMPALLGKWFGYPTMDGVLKEAHVPPPPVEKSIINDFMSQMDSEFNSHIDPNDIHKDDDTPTTNYPHGLF